MRLASIMFRGGRRRMRGIVLGIVLSVCADAASAAAEPRINWAVDSPFRLFKPGPTDGDVQSLLAALATHPSISDAYRSLASILRADGKPAARSLYRATHYNRLSGRYDAGYVTPNARRFHAQLMDPPAGASCAWWVDGRRLATQPCGDKFTFVAPVDRDGGTAADLSVQFAAASLGAQVKSRDILVLGLGDSYAAGEGNPDRPADLAALKVQYYLPEQSYAWWRNPVPVPWPKPHVLGGADGADWWGPECHRSLFSPQVLAALKLAATRPHDSVTFLSFACAGAAVLDGLLAPQENPPGSDRLQNLPPNDPLHGVKTIARQESQLQQANEALCDKGADHHPLPAPMAVLSDWGGIYRARTGRTDIDLTSCVAFHRTPNLIFITVGGNDIGFAGLVAWAMLPDLSPSDKRVAPVLTAYTSIFGRTLALVCPSVPLMGDARCGRGVALNSGAEALIAGDLPILLNFANTVLRRSGLAGNTGSAAIVQEAYPQALTDRNRRPCGEAWSSIGPWGDDRNQIWLSFHALLLYPLDGQLDTVVTGDKSTHLRLLALDPLDDRLRAVAAQTGWIVAPPPAQYDEHGFCAVSTAGSASSEFDFPRATGPMFSPGWSSSMAPKDWDAYAPRQRWLRDANDSLLTEMISDGDGGVLDESLGGTFHPTAEGEAAVADSLFATAVGALPPAD